MDIEQMTVSELMKIVEDTGATVTFENGGVFATLYDCYENFGVDLPTLIQVHLNRDSTLPKLHGVSSEHYKKYKATFASERCCMALTKKGLPCKSLPQEKMIVRPSEWDPADKIYCGTHKNWAADVVDY